MPMGAPAFGVELLTRGDLKFRIKRKMDQVAAAEKELKAG